jgi:hypothetical protein
MSDDFVDNNEILHRRIATNLNYYEIKNDGTIEISRLAFSDRKMRISVDRAKLCNNNPRSTLGNEIGIVVSLVAEKVRNIDGLARKDSKGKPVQHFAIDIEPAPLPSKPAHAEIFSIPEFVKADNNAAFRQLCRHLSRLAEEGQWAEFSKS